MCGITGYLLDPHAETGHLASRVRRMTRALIHRGPDDEGEHFEARVGLGVRRLSIVDRAHGHQPMMSDDGTRVLVYNGEIYNHRALRAELASRGVRFHTMSDTEVVLRLLEEQGIEGVQRLEGMFCFALWDRRSGELTLARDWLGQKSLYWTRTAQGFAFASEIKALLTLPELKRQPDLRALAHYMALRYLPGELTFFAGIHKLPAAHVMTVHAGGQRLQQLWRPAYEPKIAEPEERLLDELDELLASVTAEHLIGEVPLGAFLSGGIDSSLVATYASRALDAPLTTFAVGVDEESQSELPWAHRVAVCLGTRHIETLVEPDLAAMTPRMVASLEEPVDPFGAGVYVVSEVARRHVTVALGGDGGDELFAGYDRYKGQALAELYAALPRALRHGLLRPVFRRLPDSYGYNSLTARLRWLDRIADSAGFERYADSAAYLRFPHDLKAELFAEEPWRQLQTEHSEELLRPFFTDGVAHAFLDQMLHADCSTRLTDNQLPIVDRMSMAHSLELRSPFLDRRVASFAMRIPAELKLKQRRLKYVTRRLAERYLPRAIARRPKKGFGFPLALWLRGPLRELMHRTIEDSRLVDAGIWRREPLQRLYAEHTSGRMDHNYRLWMIFNLEIFWRHFFDGEDVSSLERWVRQARPMPARSITREDPAPAGAIER